MNNLLKNSEPKWKKEEAWANYYPSETWINNKKNRIRIWKTGLPLSEMKRRGHKGTYIVQTSNTKEYFKSKPQALAYAKRYMEVY